MTGATSDASISPPQWYNVTHGHGLVPPMIQSGKLWRCPETKDGAPISSISDKNRLHARRFLSPADERVNNLIACGHLTTVDWRRAATENRCVLGHHQVFGNIDINQ